MRFHLAALLCGHARNDLSISVGDGRMKAMPSALDNCLATDEYRVNQSAPGREHIGVEPHVVLADGQVGVIGGENNDVGTPTCLDRSDRTPQRPRSPS